MRNCVMCCSLTLAAVVGTASAQDSTQHHSIVPVMRSGQLITVVSGDPTKAGAPYVIRIENCADQIVFPHRHPEDEHITIVEGTWYLGTGERFDRGSLQEMSVGDYAFVPKMMAHFAWAKTYVITQIHGIGPFRQFFVDSIFRIEDPRAAGRFKFKLGQRVSTAKGEGVIGFGAAVPAENVVVYGLEAEDGRRWVAYEPEVLASEAAVRSGKPRAPAPSPPVRDCHR